jgi:hypothetical protein
LVVRLPQRAHLPYEVKRLMSVILSSFSGKRNVKSAFALSQAVSEPDEQGEVGGQGTVR